jgi:hypothetical protein
VLALAVLPSGCGGGGNAAPASPVDAAQQLLGPRDVARYLAGTPERALLDWWRSAQFADFSGYRSSFVPEVRAELDADGRAADALSYFSGSIRSARPRVLSVRASGGSATIYVLIVYHQPVGTRRFITSTVPRAFTLRRLAGRWLLADDVFVQTTLPVFLRRR